MIDNPVLLTAEVALGAAGISFLMAKFSPTIRAGWRAAISGLAPLAAVFGPTIAREDTVVLQNSEILYALGFVVAGLISATLVTRRVEAGAGRRAIAG